MMPKQSMDSRMEEAKISLDALVPKNHLVRKIDKSLSFDFICPIVESTYSTIGRPSVDPVVLVKLVFIQYLLGIRSMRQIIKEVETNLAYRWFLGLSLIDKVPHFSTFGKNYARRFRETDLFEQIFIIILEQAVDARFIHEEILYMDSTHIKANANKRIFTREMAHKEAILYQKQLEEEINESRIAEGKRPFGSIIRQEVVERKISVADPESGYYVKTEREKQFAYSAHTVCNENGFVLDVMITPGNLHDSRMLVPQIKRVKSRGFSFYSVAADAAYKTPWNAKYLIDRKLRPIFPYTRPKGSKERFKKKDFDYDPYYNWYLCPNDQAFQFRTITRDGYKKYVSKSFICESCPLLKDCTENQKHQKEIHRHIWGDYLDEAEHLRHTAYNREKYKKRKETIERVFVDAKEKHGMRYTKYRGLEKNQVHTMLVFAAMNLKKLATWQWERMSSYRLLYKNRQKHQFTLLAKRKSMLLSTP